MSRAEFLRRLASQLSSLANLKATKAHDVQAFLGGTRRPPLLGRLLASWLSAHGRALGLLHLRPHLAPLAAPFCSTIATARAFPSRAAPLLRPTALSLPLVTPALRPLALWSPGVQRPQHGAPLRLGRGTPLLAPQRTLLGREARSVELQAPPKRDSARGTSIGDACGGTSSDRCEIQLKHFCAARCFFCCVDTSSDNDEHDTDNEMLLLFSHATVTGCCPACPPLTGAPLRSPVDFLLTYFLKRSRTFQRPSMTGPCLYWSWRTWLEYHALSCLLFFV